MSIDSVIVESLSRSFGLYHDLIVAMDENVLSSKLKQLPSNTIGQQLWCVVGARESFNKAVIANQWTGFTCSLSTTTDKETLGNALRHSAHSVSETLKTVDDFSDTQNRLIVDLLEHEAAHHGQLIRYLYGLELPIPDSWKGRYSLKDR